MANDGTGTLVLDRANSLSTGQTHIGDLARQNPPQAFYRSLGTAMPLGTGRVSVLQEAAPLSLGCGCIDDRANLFSGNYSGSWHDKINQAGSRWRANSGTIRVTLWHQHTRGGTAGTFEGGQWVLHDTLTLSGNIYNADARWWSWYYQDRVMARSFSQANEQLQRWHYRQCGCPEALRRQCHRR